MASSTDERSPLLPACDISQENAILQLPNSYRVYRSRWYMLAVVFVLNVGNAMVWLSFATIVDYSASYYNKSEAYINWLSIVYLVASLLFGLPAVWVLDSVGLRAGVLLGAIFNAAGAGIRIISSLPVVNLKYKFTVVMVGQTLGAIAQVFLLVAPTKLAALWFAANERTEANMVATMSNPMGVMLASALAPIIVKNAKAIPCMLVLFSIPSFLGCVMAVLGFRSSTPPTPPTSSAESDSERFVPGLKKVLKNKAYLVLMLSYGTGVGLFTCLTTLLQQVICPQGYSDEIAGIAGAVLVAAGLFGAGLVSWLLDKTKRYEEITKVCYGLAVVACAFLLIVTQRSGSSTLVILSAGLFGFFALALVPGCLEVGVECTYPVAEATSAGLQWMTGQTTGIVLILVSQVLATKRDKHGTETCKVNADGTILDYKYSMYLMTAAAFLVGVVFIAFFKPSYRRLAEEERIVAEKILNTHGQTPS